MWYFANPSTSKVREAMRDHANHLGMISTPAQGNALDPAVRCVFDNGKFGKGWPGADAWFAWLAASVESSGPDRCAWAVAPDVPFDAEGTLAESLPWLPHIRSLGIPAAFAIQDGSEDGLVPWGEFDVVFVAGGTEWKLGPHARGLVAEGKDRGLKVHMGRVNSLRRLLYAHHIGCDSADGTYLAFGPDVNLPKLLGWLRAVNDQGSLFSVQGCDALVNALKLHGPAADPSVSSGRSAGPWPTPPGGHR